jgi:hypothetical protein
VLIPAVLIDIDDFSDSGIHRSSAISPRVSTALVVITLIIAELGLQVMHSPKEGVIQ